jgi:hypothetical protein
MPVVSSTITPLRGHWRRLLSPAERRICQNPISACCSGSRLASSALSADANTPHEVPLLPANCLCRRLMLLRQHVCPAVRGSLRYFTSSWDLYAGRCLVSRVRCESSSRRRPACLLLCNVLTDDSRIIRSFDVRALQVLRYSAIRERLVPPLSYPTPFNCPTYWR